MKKKTIQIVISEETFLQIDRLMMMEALESNTKMKTLSAWCRELLEDTVSFETNKRKLNQWDASVLKKLKS